MIATSSVIERHEQGQGLSIPGTQLLRSLRAREAILLVLMLPGPLSLGSATAAPVPSSSIPATHLAAQADPACALYDTQVWAQSIFDTDPEQHTALDPDRDGLACEELVPGAVPALWTDEVPASAILVELGGVIDGDTIDVFLGDELESVRLVGVDARESGGPYQDVECFGPEGAQFLDSLLGRRGQLFIEKDREERDHFGRLLRWVWLDIGDGTVYLLNEALIRAGYAERFRDTPNQRYVDQLMAAQEFAQRHQHGLWSACDTGLARSETPTPLPVSSAGADCDPAYPDVCIPSPPPDLACSDVPYTRFRVLPPDPHQFDGNFDGIACEGSG